MLESKRNPILEPPKPQKNYEVIFDNEKCDGCQLCIVFCPKELLGTDPDKFNNRMLHYVVFISDQACVGCRMCERLCPTASIFIKETIVAEDDEDE